MSDLICGMKLTHDGGVAVIQGNALLFSVEAEKLENRQRHAPLQDSRDVVAQLKANGIQPGRHMIMAVDGWVQGPDGVSWVEITDADGKPHPVETAGYRDDPAVASSLLAGRTGSAPLLGGDAIAFRSFTHATDHAMAAYCTSPYARDGQAALIMVWDGGMPPHLYMFDPARCELRLLGPVHNVAGGIYPIFASHFKPFRVDHAARSDQLGLGLEPLLPVSGKAMAYAALGQSSEAAIQVMAEATGSMTEIDNFIHSFMWSRRVLAALKPLCLPDPDVIASFQEYLFRLLVRGLRSKLTELPGLDGMPICLSGGCALNIKWNAGLRSSGMFAGVWVPPFPNDSGSAIGAACTEMVRRTSSAALDWSVFAGPALGGSGQLAAHWSARPCGIEEVADIIARTREPIVVLSGRAELGPRALGHRSIVASAVAPETRDLLNRMKAREWYRPVAPICLEHRAPEVFDPGSPDPYMLFDHRVRAAWRERIPAVVHADGSARLQTVGNDNPLMHRLLTRYEALTGIPVLCNTSANHKGSGFFPDAASAMGWGVARYVWAAGTLYAADQESAS